MELSELQNQLQPIVDTIKGSNISLVVLSFDDETKTGFTVASGQRPSIANLLATAAINEPEFREVFVNAMAIVTNELLSTLNTKKDE